MQAKKSNAIKVPHGQAIPEGMDLDTSDYVNEVGPHDEDLSTHPLFHEDRYVGAQREQLQDRLARLKTLAGEDAEKVEFRRRVDTRTGKVMALLYFPDGDRFGAQGNTTEEAVTQLEQKLGRLFSAEEVAS